MFGHDDNQQDNDVLDETAVTNPALPPEDSEPSADLPSVTSPTLDDTSDGDDTKPTTTTASDDTPHYLVEEEASDDTSPAPTTDKPSDDVRQPATPAVAGAGDLLSIKQEALKQLSPLVDQLNQTPEEKFRTTMMMIQAADDDSLLKTAYEAAKSIDDEKTRAQALLDIINEINYFTQQHEAN